MEWQTSEGREKCIELYVHLVLPPHSRHGLATQNRFQSGIFKVHPCDCESRRNQHCSKLGIFMLINEFLSKIFHQIISHSPLYVCSITANSLNTNLHPQLHLGDENYYLSRIYYYFLLASMENFFLLTTMQKFLVIIINIIVSIIQGGGREKNKSKFNKIINMQIERGKQ